MKKIILSLILAAFTLGLHAQVDSAAIRQAQAEQEMLRQQELLQAEQQRIADEEKTQAKEEKRLEKEQRAMEKEEALMAKQMKAAKRAERREAIGRSGRISFDPIFGVAEHQRDHEMLYSGLNYNLGLDVVYHYPLRKRWDLNVGLGYHLNWLSLRNNAQFIDTANRLATYTPLTYLNEKCTFNWGQLQLPILLSHVNADKNREFYLGVRLGFTLSSKYTHFFYTSESTHNTQETEITPGKQINKFNCRVVLGFQKKKFLFFSPGAELFFDLTPTITAPLYPAEVRSFGINIKI